MDLFKRNKNPKQRLVPAQCRLECKSCTALRKFSGTRHAIAAIMDKALLGEGITCECGARMVLIDNPVDKDTKNPNS